MRVIIAIIILIGSCPVFGCTCITDPLTEEKLAQYEFAATVKVIKMDRVDSIFMDVFTVVILEKFKSTSIHDTITIQSGYLISCGSSFNVGENYLIFADEISGRLETDVCYGNQTLDPNSGMYKPEELNKDLRFLRRKTRFR